jgi:hypothetical protein
VALNPRNRDALVEALKLSAAKVAAVNQQVANQAALARSGTAAGVTEANPPAPAVLPSQATNKG